MAQCPNCKKNMSCGCQKRTSSTGLVGCTSCITSVDKKPQPIVRDGLTKLQIQNQNLRKFTR